MIEAMRAAVVPNWVVGIAMVAIAVLTLLWGADMMVMASLKRSPWWRLPLRSGSFWLGKHFLTASLALYALIGVFLLSDPLETTPVIFAIGIISAGIDAVLAWHFLSTEKDDP